MTNNGLRITGNALRRQGQTAVTLCVIVWAAAAGGLWLAWPGSAGQWALLSGLTLLYVLVVLWRNLPHHYRPGETAVLPTLGLGNSLTLYRGLATALLAGFLFSPWPTGFLAWLPALLYMTADIADYFDGYAARITHHATRLGETLDMEYDSLSVLVVTLLAVWYGQLPLWYLPLGLARYLFVFGLWWRQRHGRAVHDLPPSVHRRIFAGFQMGFLSAVLWPIVPAAGATVAGAIFGLASAASFGRDWLIASGQIDPATAAYRRWQRRIVAVMARWLPPVLRLALAVSLALVAGERPIPAWAILLTSWGLPGAAAGAMLAMGVMVAAGTAVTLGAIGRTAAFLLVFPLGFDIAAHGLSFANGLALAATIALMLLGTGAFSLWRPEERFMARRAGEG